MLYILILLVIILFTLNVFPLLKRKYKKESILKFQELKQIKDIVIRASKSMLSSNKVQMSFNDEENLYVLLAGLKTKILNRGNTYQYFNFPRAWLMIGLLDEYEKSGEANILANVEQQSEKLIDKDGRLLFKFNKIDQSLFGVVFLRLFKITGHSKYLNATNEIYQLICSDFLLETKQLVLYRKESKVCFVDTLGMVCPFLYEYSELGKCPEASELADKQLDFYIDNAFENETHLPFHAYDLESGLKIGPVNWSRGLGWFLIGLSYAIKYSNQKDKSQNKTFEQLYDTINNKLESLKVKGLFWPQFFGHTNDNSIDTSATLMFYYSRMIASRKVDFKEFNVLLQGSINKKGYVFNSTGDTIYINKYSRQKGYSEITQGLLVSILSNI
ncbi:hypothetical protein EO244_00745 [Ancylomarina salipaludis]|uniref:Glycosyl hydrolase n=2 Tax=Ancylomarina salipaludis TaxID=2501299 RepID=A0A4Q1JPW9_9BACT|nr:hypothetical protein EO244_00745 [Ancylomarina salipaludis]